jgi:hypothetical protein
MNKKVTEEDILHYYRPVILKECKDHYKGLDWEDRVAEGYLALLYSIRTYKMKYGCFEEYFLTQFQKIMKQKNHEAWVAKKAESRYSLDESLIIGDNVSKLSRYMAADSADDSVFDINYLIHDFTLLERKVIFLRLNGFCNTDIQNRLKLSLAQAQFVLANIKYKIAEYYD